MTDWTKPTEVDDLTLAFPARVVDTLMPTRDEIPEEFWRGRTKWNTLQSDWFFLGIRDVKWEPKDGVDVATARRHLGAIQGPFEPQHEHKEAAVAYLASLWFDDVTYELAKGSVL